MSAPIVIAGGGLAAVRTAQALRDLGHEGALVLVGEEPTAPYDRPPLSKDFLLGKLDADAIALLGPTEWDDLGVELRLGQAATGIDLAARRLWLGSEELAYDRLVVATGAAPVRLAMFAGRDRACYLRNQRDAAALRAALRPGARLGIVGGGFIGLEVAAVATELGCAVTVIEAAAEPLSVVLGVELGREIRRWHERHGVAFHCGVAVAAVDGDGEVERLRLTDETALEVDLVVVGVGVRPAIGWLADSGLELHHGLVCDREGRTSDPHVFGAGDVTCRHDADGACSATGHWTAASDQARAAAAAALGREEEAAMPGGEYFWSDQYGLRLQFTGEAPPGCECRLLDGSYADDRYVAEFRSADAVTGVLALNDPRGFVKASIAWRRARLAAAAP